MFTLTVNNHTTISDVLLNILNSCGYRTRLCHVQTRGDVITNIENIVSHCDESDVSYLMCIIIFEQHNGILCDSTGEKFTLSTVCESIKSSLDAKPKVFVILSKENEIQNGKYAINHDK